MLGAQIMTLQNYWLIYEEEKKKKKTYYRTVL